MRILDNSGIEMTDPNLELGHLEVEKLLIAHHEAVPSKPYREEEGEPIWQNEDDPENALIPIIVVQEYEPAIDQWDEYENIQRYVLYTKEELNALAALASEAMEEAAEANRKAEEEAEKVLERNRTIDLMPEVIAGIESSQLDHDEAIVTIYEMIGAIK